MGFPGEIGTALFSPQGFPNGQISFNLTTTHDRDHEYLEPFEPHRRTFLVGPPPCPPYQQQASLHDAR